MTIQLSALGKLNENFKVASNERWRFVWVVDFPLFEMESGTIQSVHHPFTQPQSEIDSKNLLDVGIFGIPHYY